MSPGESTLSSAEDRLLNWARGWRSQQIASYSAKAFATIHAVKEQCERSAAHQSREQSDSYEQIAQRLVWVQRRNGIVHQADLLRAPRIVQHGGFVSGSDAHIGVRRSRCLELQVSEPRLDLRESGTALDAVVNRSGERIPLGLKTSYFTM
jgi:hypothetical protein